MSKVLVIGDLHLPFHNKNALKKVLAAIKTEKPTHIVQVGDLLDQYVFSKFTHSSKISVQKDITLGLKQAKQFWADVKRLAPQAICYQVLGNHDLRIAKRIQEKMPELAEVIDVVAHLYTFNGVKTLKSDRDYLTIEGVVYCHGWLSKSLDHAKYFNKPCVHGHLHRPCVITEGKLWSMDVGFLANEKSLPLSYTQNKFSKWRMAYGIVECGLPRLCLI